MSFVRAPNPIWFMVDLVGQPLNDEYYAHFLTNTLPYIPQNVYRDPQGMTVWTGNVINFQPSGTLPNNLYFDPALTYRIEIRRGPSQTDPLIWEINNFVAPSGGSDINNALAILDNENQITNSQFSVIDFVSPHTITTAGTYQIAPGWELVLSGPGTTTLTQLIFSGSENIVTNPPYALRINNNGWTESFLRQRFEENGALWANGAVSMSVTGRAEGAEEELTLIYSPSPPGTPEVVATGTLTTGDYQVLAGAIDLPASVNTDLSDVAFTDIILQLPPTGIVDISNVQIIGQTSNLPSDFNPLTDVPDYQQEPKERIVDHLFHYYANELIIKPKNTILTGWNFGLNPFQFRTSTVSTVTSQTQYIADQTIIHQEAASRVQAGKAGVGQRGALEIKAINGATNNRFALIQYIAPATMHAYWDYIVSSLVRARIFTSHGTQVRVKMRLIYRSSLPPVISGTEPISSWPANSDPIFSAGWTAITPLNDPAYILQNSYLSGEGDTAYPYFSFNKFILPTSTNSQQTLGIVIYTMDAMNDTLGTEDRILFDRISLVPNEFAVDTTSITFDESFRQLQYYYEKSYLPSVLPGTVTPIGRIFKRSVLAPNAPTQFHLFSFFLDYKQTKNKSPTVTFYADTSATPGQLLAGVFRDNVFSPISGGSPNPNPTIYSIAGNWTIGSQSLDNIEMACITTTVNRIVTNAATAGDEGFLLFHYTADARLGL